MKDSSSIVGLFILVIAAFLVVNQGGGSILGNRSSSSSSSSQGSGAYSQTKQAGSPSVPAGSVSPYAKNVNITSVKNPASNASWEYITFTVYGNNTNSINITGWSIKSDVTGNQLFIGTGSSDPTRVAPTPILISSGSEVTVSTGISPVGTSFQLNKCSGYFGQLNNYVPPIDRQCPYWSKQDFPEAILKDSNCMSYINTFYGCKIYPGDNFDLTPYCNGFVKQHASYEGCLNDYGSDSDFYKKEWRVFLGSNFPVWHKNKDTLRLLDAQGKVIDIYSYSRSFF